MAEEQSQSSEDNKKQERQKAVEKRQFPARKIYKLPRILNDEHLAEVHRLITHGESYNTVHKYIEEKGYHISWQSIRRYGNYYLERAMPIRTLLEQAKDLSGTVGPSAQIELADAIVLLSLKNIFDRLNKIDGTALIGMEHKDLLRSVNSLYKTLNENMRAKMDINNLIEEAKVKILECVQEELVNEPELLDRVSRIVDNSMLRVRSQFLPKRSRKLTISVEEEVTGLTVTEDVRRVMFDAAEQMIADKYREHDGDTAQ